MYPGLLQHLTRSTLARDLDRAMSMTNDVLGNATQQPTPDPGAAMRAEDDQVRVPCLRLVFYFGARIATPNGGLDRKSRCLQVTCHALDQLPRLQE